MNAKTYRTKTIQEALDQIKRDLGPEALILSTQAVSKSLAFGLLRRRSWEITAAAKDLTPATSAKAPEAAKAEAEPSLDSEAGKNSAKQKRTGNVLELAQPVIPAAVPGVAARLQYSDSRIEELLDEVSELKRTVGLIGRAIPAGTRESGGLYAELVGQGVSAELADHLVTSASRDNPAPTEMRDRIRRFLAEMLIIDPPAELVGRGRIVSLFVGPAGAGKTTTIAKIAAHAKVKYKKHVALISTDMFRVGGHEQLARYGELIGVPAYACSDANSLKDVLTSIDDRNLIMIDTAGSSPSDLTRLNKLEAVAAAASARVHLVVSANTRSEDITRTIKRFHRFSPRRVVITKIDETDPKGAFVGDILRNEMPVSFLTNGQRVPEDLLIPSAEEMSRYVIPGEFTQVAKSLTIARAQ